MLPRLRTLSLDFALAAKSVPCGRTKPRRLPFSPNVKDGVLDREVPSGLLDRELTEERKDTSLPSESLPVASLLEPYDRNDAVDTHRVSGGQAPMAGTGTMSGGGESQRSKGVWSLGFVVVMVAAGLLLP